MSTRRKTSRERWMQLTSPETLRALMRQRGFSYDRLARYAGVSKGFISHLTSGRKGTCTKPVADEIARALDVPREILFVERVSAGSGRNIRTPERAA